MTINNFLDTNRSIDKIESIISKNKKACTENDEGWISSVAFSPILNHSIGLGFIKNGRNRIGEIIRAVDPLRGNEIEVEIVSPHFLDPEGKRLRE